MWYILYFINRVKTNNNINIWLCNVHSLPIFIIKKKVQKETGFNDNVNYRTKLLPIYQTNEEVIME